MSLIRLHIQRISLLLLAFAIGLSAAAATHDDPITPATEMAISRGLSYLARQQQSDGSFTGLDEIGPRIAPAAEVVLAYLSAGQVPRVGRHALSMRNALDFILRQLPDDGGFGVADGSGIEGQAIITIALAECYGFETDTTERASLREALNRSKQFILSAQDQKQGGWVADGKRDPDLVSTFWMVLSLHALVDAGFEIPAASLDRAASFALSRGKSKSNVFTDLNAESPAASNAAGLAILRFAMPRGDFPTTAAIKSLVDKKPDPAKGGFHGTLYMVTLAAYLWGDPVWTPSWKAAQDRLISKQTEDGSWFPPVAPAIGLGTISSTAKAILTLTVPYQLMPLYGR
jgi:hypothetical protein